MKKYILILVLAISFVSCKKEKQEGVVDKGDTVEKVNTEAVYSGDFLAVDNSAILTMGNETIKVEMNDLCKELIDKSKAFQKTAYDFVNVKVKGTISDNPNANEWKKVIRISAIEHVTKSKTEDNITVVK